MCGIAGILNLNSSPIQNLDCSLRIMNKLQKHRGPDGEGSGLTGKSFWDYPM